MDATQKMLISFEADATKAIAAVKSIDDRMGKLADSVGKTNAILSKIAIPAAVTAGFVTAIKGIDAAFNRIAEIGTKAQSLGTSAAGLKGLGDAAKALGLDANAVEQPLAKLSKMLDDAAAGSKAVTSNFRALKIDPSQFKDSTEAFKAIADHFATLPDGAQKTALAVRLFGDEGARLVPILNQGGDALNQFALANGDAFSSEHVRQAQMYQRTMAEFTTTIEKLATTFAINFLPGITEWLENTKVLVTENGKLLGLIKAVDAIFSARTAKGETYEGQAAQKLNDLLEKRAALEATISKTEGTRFAYNLPLLRTRLAGMDDEIEKQRELLRESKRFNESAKTTLTIPKITLPEMPKLAETGKAVKVVRTEFDVWIESLKRTDERVENLALKTNVLDAYLKAGVHTIERHTAEMRKIDPTYKTLAETMTDIGRGIARQGNDWIAFKDRILPADAAARELSKTLLQIDDALSSGDLTLEEHTRAYLNLSRASTDASASMVGISESMQTVYDALNSGLTRGMDNFIDSIGRTKFSFTDMTESILKDLARMLVRVKIMEPLMRAMQGWFGGSSVPMQPGGGYAMGGAFSLPTGYPQGVYTTPQLFPALGAMKNYANGGVFGLSRFAEAGPEAIMPLRRTSTGRLGVEATTGSAPINVIVNNNAQAQISTRETRRSDGGRDIQIVVEDMVKTSIARGGLDRSMQKVYALPRRGF